MIHWIEDYKELLNVGKECYSSNKGRECEERVGGKKEKNTYRESVSLTLNHSLVSPGKGLYKLMDELPHFFTTAQLSCLKRSVAFPARAPL